MFPEMVNIVLIGDGYVGKTSIVHYLKFNQFREHVSNMYDQFYLERQFKSANIGVRIIDTAGQEEYENLNRISYSQADVFLVCYSIVNPISFENIETRWLAEIKNYRMPKILVGTKADSRRECPKYIPLADAKKLGRKIKAAGVFECSSKSGEGVMDIIDFALREVCKKQDSRCSLI